MRKLIRAIENGETIIYPTETLYALGCDATSDLGCEAVMCLKRRSALKPLPLIIGNLDMLDMVTAERTPLLEELAASFWPGPLSILVKARPELPEVLSDSDGFTSVRWSGHPFATELSRRVHKPLVATSANYAGTPSVASPEKFDQSLLRQVGAAYLDPPWPKGGAPSTVLRLHPFNRVAILREGVVTLKMLCDKGLSVEYEK